MESILDFLYYLTISNCYTLKLKPFSPLLPSFRCTKVPDTVWTVVDNTSQMIHNIMMAVADSRVQGIWRSADPARSWAPVGTDNHKSAEVQIDEDWNRTRVG